jgi:hypothetical protein
MRRLHLFLSNSRSGHFLFARQGSLACLETSIDLVKLKGLSYLEIPLCDEVDAIDLGAAFLVNSVASQILARLHKLENLLHDGVLYVAE